MTDGATAWMTLNNAIDFRRTFADAIGIAGAAVVDQHIPADGPGQLLQPLMEGSEACLSFRIIGG